MNALKPVLAWMVSALGVAGLPSAAAALGFEELALAKSSDDFLHVFAVDSDGSITHAWPSEPAGAWIGAEPAFGSSSDVAALPRADGRFEVFAVDATGSIATSAQSSDGYDWSPWVQLGGDATRLAAASSGDRAGLFFIGMDGELWFAWRDGADAGWADWQSTGVAAKQVAAAAADGGKFAVAAIEPGGAVRWGELDPTAPGAVAWEILGGQAVDLAAARLADGSLVLAISGDDRGVSWNERRGSTWGGWQALGGAAQRVDLAEVNGELDLIALHDTVVTRARRASDGGWGEWQVAGELSPFATTFRGTASVDIPEQDISEDRRIELGIRFSVDRTRVEISDFPPIVTDSFDTPFGSSRSTVTLAHSEVGQFDRGTGEIDIPVTLEFDQSLDVPLIEEDVRAELLLSTDEPGAVYDASNGALALAAGGALQAIGNGINPLDGFDVDVVITGTLDPPP